MVINTNVEAMSTMNNLAVTQANLAKSLSRLSSGSKIVTPSDDAAGLAVSNRLEAQVKRIDSAMSNVVNAKSWTQTQDGFMKNISTASRRMSELAMLAQDATKSNGDRDLYNKELQELKNFVLDTSKQDYNGVSMFAGVSLDVTVDSEGTTFSMASIDLGNYVYNRATNSGSDAWKLNTDAHQLSKDGFTLKSTAYKTSMDLWRDSAGSWSKTDNSGTKIKAGSIVTEDVTLTDDNAKVYATGTFINSTNDAIAIKGFKVDSENNQLKLAANHGLANGDAIKFNGTAPTGLNSNTTYYAKVVDSKNVEVYSDQTLINKVNLYNKAEVTGVTLTGAPAVVAVAQVDTITVTAGNHAGDTFAATVNGTTTAAIASVVGNDNTTATNLATAINAIGGVAAAAVGNVITITAGTPGTPITGATSVALANTDGANATAPTIATTTANVAAAAAGVNAQFTKQNHGFSTGDAVIFNDAASAPAGATANTTYFVNKVTKDTFKLYTDATNAYLGGATNLAAVTADASDLKLESNIVSGVTADSTTEVWTKSGHGLIDGDVVQVVESSADAGYEPVMTAGGAAFNVATDAHVKRLSNTTFDLYKTKVESISINQDSTQFSKTAHGLADNTAVQFLGSSPTGASYTATYYVKSVSTNVFQLHTSVADVAANTNAVTIKADYTSLDLVKDKVGITTSPTNHAYLKLKEAGSLNVDDYSVTAGEDNANVVKRGYFVNIDPVTNGEDAKAVKVKSGEFISINQSDQDISSFATIQSEDYKNINVKSVEGAKIALDMIKNAITLVATDRASLGATQSRLNFTNDQLNITKENLSAAISRIADVDVAEEATRYARFQILVATGTQMLKQANQLPQGAIELLR